MKAFFTIIAIFAPTCSFTLSALMGLPLDPFQTIIPFFIEIMFPKFSITPHLCPTIHRKK
jgi:hypothetical protein